jgi:DNA polymerase III delta' subunit
MTEWREQKRVPPVLLLTGIAGIGKREIATFIAQWILCEKNGIQEKEEESAGLFGDLATPLSDSSSADPLPCGECRSCQRALSGNWVDFTEISPEEEGGSLKIEQFRKLKSTVGFGAHEGDYKVTLIPHAERMTPQAANSLLKILEEPPRGWVFLLTAHDPTLLLPTLVSRCQRLRLKPFPESSLLSFLEQNEIRPERRTVCARLAQGSWRRAVELAEEDNWTHRQELFEFLAQPAAHFEKMLLWASESPEQFNQLVTQLEQIVADLLTGTQNGVWNNSDGKAALEAHVRSTVKRLGSEQSARAFWFERAERLAQARQEEHAPLNRKIVLQDVLMPWMTG